MDHDGCRLESCRERSMLPAMQSARRLLAWEDLLRIPEDLRAQIIEAENAPT